MKAIKTNAIISSIRRKTDKSLGLTISTPEVTNEEAIAIMELQGVNIDLWMKPLDETPEEVIEIDKEIEQKSQATRIRAVLFLLWKQEGEQGEFNTYYKEKTEKYLDWLKEKLD